MQDATPNAARPAAPALVLAERRPPSRTDRLADEIAQLSSHIEAATYRLLCLIREFDEANGWSNTGAQSLAHWLNWRIGWGLPAARERVRVARALGELPLLSAALRKGEVSYSKVRAITRIATPENEETLVSYAYYATASQIERIVRGYRCADRAQQQERDTQRHIGRELHTWTDDNGMLVIRGRLSPELGAVVLKALEQAEAQLPPGPSASPAEGPRAPQDVSAETSDARQRPRASQRRADALGLMAQAALDQQMRRGSAADRTQVVLHVDVDAPEELGTEELGTAELGTEELGTAELGTGRLEPNLHVGPETVRRLSCDASTVTMQHGADGSVLDVGRKTRTIPPAIRRALQSRDQTCRFPACTHTRYLDAHHLRHWADGGATKLQNLIHTCSFHHRLLHEGGYRVVVEPSGELTFYQPSGRAIPAVPRLPGFTDATAETLEAHNAAAGLAIDDQTLGTWQGDHPDYPYAVEGLWRYRRGKA